MPVGHEAEGADAVEATGHDEKEFSQITGIVQMIARRDPDELIDMLRYLIDTDELMKAWRVGTENPDSYGAAEHFSVIFDDLHISQSKEIYRLDSTIELLLRKALGLREVKLCVNNLFNNPDFCIARKICELL